MEIKKKDLQELLEALRSARDGETGVRLSAEKSGVMGDVAKAFNALAERLDDLVRPTIEVSRVLEAVADGELARAELRPIDPLEQIRQDFVSTVSHELRTPLAAIYGSALTLAREDLKLEEAMHRKLLEVVVEESTRLVDIVNDLLLASQLDAGRLELCVEPCDAHALAASVLDAARTHLPEGVRVSLDPGQDGLPWVVADEGRLRQVLGNLIDNAVKYSPAGGDVQVRLEAAGRYVRFSVADEGLGIPPAEQGRIFEKFYRLDPELTGGIGGTGLGLYISGELVRRVHGRIWVEPGDAGGSVFHVEIPAASEPSAGQNTRKRARAST
ncbi:MAG: HAMP domain-containing sensor histidine kinase [Gaiellaceae bacterium]